MKRKIIIVISCIAILCLFAAVIYFRNTKQKDEVQSQKVDYIEENRKTLEYNGVTYYPKQNQKLILFMGISEQGLIDSEMRQEDVTPESILVISLDENNKKYSLLQLNYHTSADIVLSDKNVSSVDETGNAGIADAYLYGKDVKDQCMNLEATISNYLTGIEFDNYILCGIDAMKLINDSLGGSSVCIEDDFSEVDPFLVKGEEITLFGDHVLSYVKTLPSEDPLTRAGSLKRQMVVFTNLMNNLRTKTKADNTFLIQLFQKLENYIQTDCSIDRLISTFCSISDYSMDQSINLIGGATEKDGKTVYEVNQKQLMDTCINLYYQEKQ